MRVDEICLRRTDESWILTLCDMFCPHGNAHYQLRERIYLEDRSSVSCSRRSSMAGRWLYRNTTRYSEDPRQHCPGRLSKISRLVSVSRCLVQSFGHLNRKIIRRVTTTKLTAQQLGYEKLGWSPVNSKETGTLTWTPSLMPN